MSDTAVLSVTSQGSTKPWYTLLKEGNIQECIKAKDGKKAINYVTNGGATLVNAFTFLNANFNFIDGIQEKLESISGVYTRIATGTQGLILSSDNWVVKNLIPTIGFALEIPIAIFSDSYNLWLYRGLSQGAGQLLTVLDRREVVDEKGKPKIKDGNITLIGNDFTERGGFLGSFTTFFKEVPKLVKELIKEPSIITKKISHSLFVVSTFQIIGALTAMAGFKNIGAPIRNIAGIGVDWSLLTDIKPQDIYKPIKGMKIVKAESQQKKGLDFNSLLVWAGMTWITAAVVDQLKRIPGIEDKIAGLTNLALTSDRGASTFLTNANLETTSKGNLNLPDYEPQHALAV